jgi:hypothetical protein
MRKPAAIAPSRSSRCARISAAAVLHARLLELGDLVVVGLLRLADARLDLGVRRHLEGRLALPLGDHPLVGGEVRRQVRLGGYRQEHRLGPLGQDDEPVAERIQPLHAADGVHRAWADEHLTAAVDDARVLGHVADHHRRSQELAHVVHPQRHGVAVGVARLALAIEHAGDEARDLRLVGGARQVQGEFRAQILGGSGEGGVAADHLGEATHPVGEPAGARVEPHLHLGLGGDGRGDQQEREGQATHGAKV